MLISSWGSQRQSQHVVSHTSQCTSPGACHCTASTHGQLVQAAPSPSVPGAHASLRRRGSSGRVITDIALSSSPFPSQRMQRHCSAGSVCMGWRPLRCTAGSALTTWGAPLHSTPGPAKPTGLLSVSHPARQDVKPTAQPVDDPQQRHRAGIQRGNGEKAQETLEGPFPGAC